MVRSSKRNRLIWPDPPNRNQRSFSELPEVLTFQILTWLGAIDVLTSARKVCSLWRRCCKHPMLWRTIDMAIDHFFDEYHYDLDRMCRHAVDLSSEKVEDINVECFGSDNLLKYISDSSNGIKRLRLAHCDRITDEGLSKAARKLPLLEELDITSCKNISHEPLKVIGFGCPLLKSFKLDTWFEIPEYEEVCCEDSDEEEEEVNADVDVDVDVVAVVDMDMGVDSDALAIAGSMHGLRHLQLFWNELTNDGLSKILDHCPHLESLDLRCCHNLNLKGDLGVKYAERIRRLQLPHDSTDIPETDGLQKGKVQFTRCSGDDVDDCFADQTLDFTDGYEW